MWIAPRAATGLTQQNVAQSLLVALSGSFQTARVSISTRAMAFRTTSHPGAAVRMNSMAQLESCPLPELRRQSARDSAFHGGAGIGGFGRAWDRDDGRARSARA